MVPSTRREYCLSALVGTAEGCYQAFTRLFALNRDGWLRELIIQPSGQSGQPFIEEIGIERVGNTERRPLPVSKGMKVTGSSKAIPKFFLTCALGKS